MSNLKRARQESDNIVQSENDNEATKKIDDEVINWEEKYNLLPKWEGDKKRGENGEFLLRVYANKERVNVDIFRNPSYELREDGFDAIDLMFSGKVLIIRDFDGTVRNLNTQVTPLHYHHANHFGHQRGQVIGIMIQILSKELEELYLTVRLATLGF